MGYALSLFGAISQWDQTIWRGQNFLRRSAEYIEWQLKQLPMPEALEIENAPSWLDPLLTWVVRGIAFLLVSLLLRWAIRKLWPWMRRWRRSAPDTSTVKQRTLEPTLSAAEWLARAERAQNQQEYAKACRALYMALLMRLETTGRLSRDPARTDQEYLQRLDALWALDQQSIEVPKAWRQIFQIHERSYYGNQAIAVETYHDCQRAYQTLEPALQPQTSGTDP